MAPSSPAPSAWARALALAEQTPPERNRYVDFLRAASIGVVVGGHWLLAAPVVGREELTLSDMLRTAPWSQWLTWAFQVMPLFFIVGGYANGISWDAAARRGIPYAGWLAARMRRLVGPVVPLVVLWSGVAVAAHLLGLNPELMRSAYLVAFAPVWFLAVYVAVTMVAPASYWAWRRFGLPSFVFLALGAALIDALAFAGGLSWLRWGNYAFVWIGVHQLGYAWRAGHLEGPARSLGCAALGLAGLVALVGFAGYPTSMITVPGEVISNSRPPTLALLFLGMFHGGLVLAGEPAGRRWLERVRPWAATVLINASIMTLYLWHATALVVLIGAALLLGGPGLGLEPASGVWWATRPIWLALLAVVLAPFMLLFGRFEARVRAPEVPPAAWSSVGGALATTAGLALLVVAGIGADNALGLRVEAVALTLVGALAVFWGGRS
jgi:hypothetical protein